MSRYLFNNTCMVLRSAQCRYMERDRGISREWSEHVRAIEHLRSIQTWNTTVFLVSRAEQESAGVSAVQSWCYHCIANELAIGCLHQRVRLINSRHSYLFLYTFFVFLLNSVICDRHLTKSCDFLSGRTIKYPCSRWRWPWRRYVRENSWTNFDVSRKQFPRSFNDHWTKLINDVYSTNRYILANIRQQRTHDTLEVRRLPERGSSFNRGGLRVPIIRIFRWSR